MLRELIGYIITIVTILFTLAFSIFILMLLWMLFIGQVSCKELGEGLNTKTEFKFWYGCFVTMPDGRILPENIAREVMKNEHKFNIKSSK